MRARSYLDKLQFILRCSLRPRQKKAEALTQILMKVDSASGERQLFTSADLSSREASALLSLRRGIQDYAGREAATSYSEQRARFFDQVGRARAEQLSGSKKSMPRRRFVLATIGVIGVVAFVGANGQAAARDLEDLGRLPKRVVHWVDHLIAPSSGENETPQIAPVGSSGELEGKAPITGPNLPSWTLDPESPVVGTSAPTNENLAMEDVTEHEPPVATPEPASQAVPGVTGGVGQSGGSGQPDGLDQPQGAGPPEGVGQPEDKGLPEGVGQSGDEGPPEGVGQPEDKGPPEGVSQSGNSTFPVDTGVPNKGSAAETAPSTLPAPGR